MHWTTLNRSRPDWNQVQVGYSLQELTGGSGSAIKTLSDWTVAKSACGNLPLSSFENPVWEIDLLDHKEFCEPYFLKVTVRKEDAPQYYRDADGSLFWSVIMNALRDQDIALDYIGKSSVRYDGPPGVGLFRQI